MQTEHTYKQYDAELEAVRAKVLQMGGLVEQQIINALESLISVNPKLAKEVMEADQRGFQTGDAVRRADEIL
jgi:phosphate transport system protein